MKNFIILLIVLISFSCKSKISNENHSKNNENVVAIAEKNTSLPMLVYTANTRGFYEKIIIENNKFSISKKRGDKEISIPKDLTTEQIKELSKLYNLINLNELATYKDPTQKRFYDGAAIANLKIIVGDVEYKTVAFDHGTPPIQIEKFVNAIVSLSNKE